LLFRGETSQVMKSHNGRAAHICLPVSASRTEPVGTQNDKGLVRTSQFNLS
jgi:hypothetical protein